VCYAHGLLLRKAAAMNVKARIKHPDEHGQREPQLYHKNMELVRLHNAICDKYQLSRAHKFHPDLPRRNVYEKQGFDYFESLTTPSPSTSEPAAALPSLFDPISDEALLELHIPSPQAAVHAALQISAVAAASDTPPPSTVSSASNSLASAQPPSLLTHSTPSSSALVPSWMALPLITNQPSLAGLGLRQLPSLKLDGSPFDRPFEVEGLPSLATLGERRADAKAARDELACTVTAEAFNKLLGSGELFLEPGEEWMLTHPTKHKNLCLPGSKCFEENGIVDKNGNKRRPPRMEMHDRMCKQRKCLEVQAAWRKGQRVVKRK